MCAHVVKTLSSTQFRQNIRKGTHTSVSVHKNVHGRAAQCRRRETDSAVVLLSSSVVQKIGIITDAMTYYAIKKCGIKNSTDAAVDTLVLTNRIIIRYSETKGESWVIIKFAQGAFDRSRCSSEYCCILLLVLSRRLDLESRQPTGINSALRTPT